MPLSSSGALPQPIYVKYEEEKDNVYFIFHLYLIFLSNEDPKQLALFSSPAFYPHNIPMKQVWLQVWDIQHLPWWNEDLKLDLPTPS